MKVLNPFSIGSMVCRRCLPALIAFGATGLIFSIGTTTQNNQYSDRIHEISRGPLDEDCVALTFDAGGEADNIENLLAALKKAQVHSTFFLAGEWALKHPEIVRQIVIGGHEIGNHSWSHPDLTRLSDENIRTQIEKTDALLVTLTGRSSKPLFRAPFGARNERVLRLVAELGYRSIYWTIDSLDSVDPPKTTQFLINRITAKTDETLDGAIILMHVGEPTTAAAVPWILADLQQRGFKPVTISELLNLQ